MTGSKYRRVNAASVAQSSSILLVVGLCCLALLIFLPGRPARSRAPPHAQPPTHKNALAELAWPTPIVAGSTPAARGYAAVRQHIAEHDKAAGEQQAKVASPIFDVRSLIAAAQEYHALSQSDGRPVQLEKLEEKAFPWLLDPVSSLRQQWTPGSRGIVFTFTKSDSIYAYTLMRAIRHLGSQLPIVVMYGGASDLPDTFRAVFEEIRDISFVDMSKMLRWDVAQVKTYAHKPFAMLFAPFEEVMVVDADAGFFQTPDPLFDDVRFRETGTLFFSDRSVLWTHETGRYVSQWVSSLLPNLSDAAKSLRVFRGISNHEQESAVVLINKRGAALHGLLLACALNAHPVRPDVYRNVLGDKETYWIAFEALGLPYAFMPVYAGAMGFLSRHWYTNNAVCGFLIHFDRSGQPLWWNGGVVHDRNPPLRYWNFTHYKADTTDSGAEWQILPQEENQSCLNHFGDGDVPANAVQELPQQDVQLVQWMVQVQKDALAESKWHSLWTEANVY